MFLLCVCCDFFFICLAVRTSGFQSPGPGPGSGSLGSSLDQQKLQFATKSTRSAPVVLHNVEGPHSRSASVPRDPGLGSRSTPLSALTVTSA